MRAGDGPAGAGGTPAADTRAPIRVGYVAGYGRSGTTVLDILLGQHPDLLGVGELTNLARRVWPNNEHCSCGARVRDCPFWSEVVRRFAARFDDPALAAYAGLQARYEGLTVLARAAAGRLGRDAAFADYQERTRVLFAILTEVSGKPAVIDSSKLPGRAFALASAPGIDLGLIHLVRDGRGVAWSLGKAYAKDERSGIERPLPRRPVPRTALRWAMVNLGAERVARRLGPGHAVRLRYEDLVTDPAAELARLAPVTRVDLGPVIARLRAGEAFDTGHIVAGSRLRMTGRVSLRFDQEWRRLMPKAQQRVFQLLAGRLQRRYGYS